MTSDRLVTRSSVLTVLGALVVFLLVWRAIVLIGGYPPFILPAPEVVFGRFVTAVTDGTIWPHLATTLQEVALGFIVGAGSGVGTIPVKTGSNPLAADGLRGARFERGPCRQPVWSGAGGMTA